MDDDEDIESPPAPPAPDEVSPDDALLSAVESEEVVAGVGEPQPIRSIEDPKRSAEVRMGFSCRLESYREQAEPEHGACPRCTHEIQAEFRRFLAGGPLDAIGQIAPG
jgi:hypothetical protein